MLNEKLQSSFTKLDKLLEINCINKILKFDTLLMGNFPKII